MEATLTRVPGDALEGTLEFDEAEHSFRFKPASPMDLVERVNGDGLTSLSIGTLQVEVAVATGALLFAWGLHPRALWCARAIGSPAEDQGVVCVTHREMLTNQVR